MTFITVGVEVSFLYFGREGFVTIMVKVLKIISRLVTSKNNSIYGIYIEKYLLQLGERNSHITSTFIYCQVITESNTNILLNTSKISVPKRSI